MSDVLKIGELARQTGLSIRTLHYYDEIGLLSPSHRSRADHRLYTRQDIIRLQQIMSLRQLGLSLKEIHNCLENPDFSLLRVIELHRVRVHEQMTLSRRLSQRLEVIAQALQTSQSVAVEDLIQTMETITMTTQYFTPKQQETLEVRFREGEADWQQLLSEIRTEMNKGSDLNSPAVRMLARRWLWSMKTFVQGDGEIYESLVKMYQQEGIVAVEWGMDSAAFEFILKAIFSMALGDFTDAAIPRNKIFTAQTQEVIRLGEKSVREINFGIIGTEAILLGILAEGRSDAARILAAAGVSYEAAQPIVVKWLGTRPTPPDGSFPQQLPFAPRVKRVIELALDEEKQTGRSRISPELLLLGILAEYRESPPPGGVASYILREELGVDLQQLEQQIRANR